MKLFKDSHVRLEESYQTIRELRQKSVQIQQELWRTETRAIEATGICGDNRRVQTSLQFQVCNFDNSLASELSALLEKIHQEIYTV